MAEKTEFGFDEESLLAKIRELCGPLPGGLGIGDDAAILPNTGTHSVVTVDALVEGVHFDAKFSSPEDLGHKLLAVSLSDLAAMGATPQYAIVSLALTPQVTEAWIAKLYGGLLSLARRHGVIVAGGNLTRAKQLFLDLTLVGQPNARSVLRSGGRAGDAVMVTGELGRAAAGLEALQAGVNRTPEVEICVQAQLRPEPRVEIGQHLARESSVTSMMDVSDGLVRDLLRLTRASNTGVRLEESRLPVGGLHMLAERLGFDTDDCVRNWALQGGEDYELLFTVDPSHLAYVQKKIESLGVYCTFIGVLTEPKAGCVLLRQKGGESSLLDSGWDPFRN